MGLGRKGGTLRLTAARPGRILLLSLVLVVITRLPFLPAQLVSFDNVNLALALQEFDPAKHQPQPPGYPLFVAAARALLPLLQTPELTFQVMGLLSAGVSVVLLGLLGGELFSPWVGRAASLLFLVNPVLWFSSVASPLRPHLALVSIGVAYCCWRLWRGDRRFLYPSAVVLGLGSGFRPELLALLFPLWLASAWKSARSVRMLAGPVLALSAASATWITALVLVTGGPVETLRLFGGYFVDQSSQESLVLGGSAMGWTRMVGRLLLWNGLAWLAAPLVLPLVQWRRLADSPLRAAGPFLALWTLPPLAFQFFFHVAAPGHTLSTIPVFCLLAAVALENSGEQYGIWGAAPRRETVLMLALLLNVLVFIAPFEHPARSAVGWKRYYYALRDAVLYARFETSAGMLQHLENSMRESLARVAELRGAGPVALVVWNGAPMSWRQGTYYVPDLPFCVLDDATAPGHLRIQAVYWRFNRVLHISSGTPTRVALPSSGRIIWLLNPGSDFQREVARVVPLQAEPPLFYTRRRDLPASFQVGPFLFERSDMALESPGSPGKQD